jgi:apolipoprotein N-acyltransferase
MILYVLSWFIVAFASGTLLTWLMPVAAACGYALFWRSIEGMKSRFTLSTLWWLGVNMVQLSWVATTTYNGPLMWLVYLFVALGQAPLFGILNKYLPPLGFAGAWAILEWGRQFFLCGFPFAPVGAALGKWTVGLQLASVIGSSGLTLVVLLTNALLYEKGRSAWWLACLPYVAGGIIFLGPVDHQGNLQVALIEPKITPPVAGDHPEGWRQVRGPYENWALYFPALEQLREQRIDIIGFPEAAFVDLGDIDHMEFMPIDRMLCSLFGEGVREHYPDHGPLVSHAFVLQVISNYLGVEVIAGLMANVPGGVANSAVHFKPRSPHAIYGKRRLLPVAESMSLPIFRMIGADFGIFDSFTPAKGPMLFKGMWAIYPTVCYEETFSQASLEAAKLGADLLFNVTNDGWYPRSRLDLEQRSLAQLRSIETGRPSLRACNTGGSGGFNAKGEPLVGRQIGDVVTLTCPIEKKKTLYTLFGDVFLFALSLGLCIYALTEKERSRAQRLA